MDVGKTEKGGNFLSKILRSNPTKNLTVPQSDFEKELFKDGAYAFDFDKEVQEAEGVYHRTTGWLHHRLEPDRVQNVLAGLASSESWDLAWKQAFSDRIPKNWDVWGKVMVSFKEAGRRNIQLSPVLVNAGVSHDFPSVVYEAGKSQRLTPQQLGFVLGRDNLSQWISDRVIATQKAKGMTTQEYDRARAYAEKIKEIFRKTKRNKRDQLPSSNFP